MIILHNFALVEYKNSEKKIDWHAVTDLYKRRNKKKYKGSTCNLNKHSYEVL